MTKVSHVKLLCVLFILVFISGCQPKEWVYAAEAQQCAAAFSARVEEGQPQLPALILKHSDWEEDGWEEYSHPFVPDILEGQTIRTLICIYESRVDTHDVYIGGARVNPYRLIWDIRIVELPSGRVIGSGQFTGGDPPSEVRTSYEAVDLYGVAPKIQLIRLAAPVFGKIIPLDGEIKAITFSPDGRYLVSSTRSALQMWEVATGELVVDYGDAYSSSPVFSPDGSRLATIQFDRLRIWDAQTGELIHDTENPDSLNNLLYSPDGTLIIGMSDEQIFFWNAENGETIRTLELGDTNNICISPNGDTLAVASGSGPETVITFLDPATGNVIRSPINTGYVFDCFYYSPDGKLLTIGGDEILDTTTMRPVANLGYSSMCAFSPDSSLIALEGNLDDEVYLKNVVTGEEIAVFAGHGGWIKDFTFSPDGKWLAVAVESHTDPPDDRVGYIRLWDLTPYLP